MREVQYEKGSFGIDAMLICPKCSGKMRLVASLTAPDSIATYLRAIGEPTDPPELSPARAPPQLMFDDFDQDPTVVFSDDDFIASP